MNRPSHLLAILAILLASSSLSQQQQQEVLPVDFSTAAWSPIEQVLKYSSIIPDVLDDFTPSISLNLAYPSSHESVALGNTISPDAAAGRPVFEFHKIATTLGESNEHGSGHKQKKAEKTYTLILTDPDAKSRKNPKWSEFCHWVVTGLTDIPELSLKETNGNTNIALKKKEGEVVKYTPPAPPEGTGRHRYVFVLLEGDRDQELSMPSKRKHWGYKKPRHGVRDWARENNLTVVGANFFYAQYEEEE